MSVVIYYRRRFNLLKKELAHVHAGPDHHQGNKELVSGIGVDLNLEYLVSVSVRMNGIDIGSSRVSVLV